MLPLLELVADGKDHLMKDVTRGVANRFELSEDERANFFRAASKPSSAIGWLGRRPI